VRKNPNRFCDINERLFIFTCSAMPNKKSDTPKRKRMNRSGRLQSAKGWICVYRGKNLVQGYAKHFGTNLLLAIFELRILGITVSTEYEEAIKRSMADRAKQKQSISKLAKEHEAPNNWEDENFSFIAGYTSGGAPYGISKIEDAVSEEPGETEGLPGSEEMPWF
jgi:hypothetical protein